MDTIGETNMKLEDVSDSFLQTMIDISISVNDKGTVELIAEKQRRLFDDNNQIIE
jgi:hypothetical protein